MVITSDKITISFLVPTLGERKEELQRLLESLSRQTYNYLEVVIVAQDNFDMVQSIIEEYNKRLIIHYVRCESKGLSKARNVGLTECKGTIVVLSDDDCWYPDDASKKIVSRFYHDEKLDVLLSKIYDKTNDQSYKSYGSQPRTIRSPFELSSKSSIEISFRNKYENVKFDELFGLGAHFVCCEEVDFLIQLLRKKAKIVYFPIDTVYHDKKNNKSSDKQIAAKGAFYAKDFVLPISLLICVKDLISRKENNFRSFFIGYSEYKKITRNNTI